MVICPARWRVNWGNGFVTDKDIMMEANISDATPFFKSIMSKPWISQVPYCSHGCMLPYHPATACFLTDALISPITDVKTLLSSHHATTFRNRLADKELRPMAYIMFIQPLLISLRDHPVCRW